MVKPALQHQENSTCRLVGNGYLIALLPDSRRIIPPGQDWGVQGTRMMDGGDR